MKTNIDFVNYLLNILDKNTIYMWGQYGKLVTKKNIEAKKKQYPTHYSNDKVNYLYSLIRKNYYSFDCSGLINSFWMSNYGLDKVKYQRIHDKNSYDITIGEATKYGPINTIPEIPGLLLYMKGHCGVYLGNNKVIECTSNEDISKKKYGGVCISNLNDRKWEYWTMSKKLKYI